jgi:Subunit 17 of Mediator complex
MIEPLVLPFRVPTSKRSDDESLQSRIFQLYSQKGDFRTITETSLKEDIKSQKQEVVVDVSRKEEPESRQELIIKRREEMMQQLRYVK